MSSNLCSRECCSGANQLVALNICTWKTFLKFSLSHLAQDIQWFSSEFRNHSFCCTKNEPKLICKNLKKSFFSRLTSDHSDECHFGLQSFISSVVQSSNVGGFDFKSHSLSSANPSSLMHTTVRDFEALKQSPEHKLHGPINQSPWHLTSLVHSRYVLGVSRTSHLSVFGGVRSQKTVLNCWPLPHSLEQTSLLNNLIKSYSISIKMCSNWV